MEAAELDVQIEELEVRLERLRALYEQYFMGIEKLEPTVPRKDVDRRIYLLRREKIRNTGKRFKLQTIIQRYNTFQQYWHRICREIENGTYRRHVLRAEKTFGPQDLLTIAARKRFGREARANEPAPTAHESTPAPPESAAPEPAAPSPPSPVAAAPPPPPVRAAAAPPAKRAGKPQQFESLDLDMDFLGDWDPASVKRAPAKAPSAPPEPAKKRSEAPPPARPAQPVQPSAAKSAAPPPPAPAASPPVLAPAARPAAGPPPLVRKPLPRPELKPAAATATPALDEARIRDLHGKLNELKRQNQEAGQVSLEGLARSLRATEEKLRKQHAGRRIDFDIVVKDGKAVVKPIVR